MRLTAAQRIRNRAVAVGYVTLVECAGLYAWLRLSQSGHATLGAACLILEETLESGVLLYIFLKGPQREYDRGDPAVASHLRGGQIAAALAINAEILIWLLWLSLARATSWLPAGLALWVSMHLKHQLEAATVFDTPLRAQFRSPLVVIGSLTEVAGGVAGLQLLRADHLFLAAVALVAGIGFEHILFIDAAQSEMESRDICLPKAVSGPGQPPPTVRRGVGQRSSTWRRRGLRYTVTFWLGTHLSWFWWAVNRSALLRSLFNAGIINQYVAPMEPRPGRLSTKSDYTSWDSLTDRTYSARHLPPWPSDRRLPAAQRVAELFRCAGPSPRRSQKSTLLFPFFAQWFVDGFLRTAPENPLRNTSSHDIDLSQLYGHDPAHTRLLRSGSSGELKCQAGRDGEYPPYYFDEKGEAKPEFKGLPMIYPGLDPKARDPGTDSTHPYLLDPERRSRLFALGLPRGNIHYGTAMMSTVFLREHNRLARLIAEGTGWDRVRDDDRIFETARNTLIVMLLKVVLQDYINHITPFRFRVVCEPGIGAERRWFRQNWMSLEFDLLYRWHALMPDCITVHGQPREVRELLWDTTPLTEEGIAALVDEASGQPCAEIGLLNTPHFLLDVERRAIEIGRRARLAGYNDYRQACRYPRLTSFADVCTRADVQMALAACYPTVDDVELYVGLFAEDVVAGGALPDLMGTMVAVDAFSQALTNPLLDQRIFSAQTFSEVGMEEIERTNELRDIVCRNTPNQTPRVSFTQEPPG